MWSWCAVRWMLYYLTFVWDFMKTFNSKNILSATCIYVMLMTPFLFLFPSRMLNPFVPHIIPFIPPFNLPWKWKLFVLWLFGAYWLNVKVVYRVYRKPKFIGLYANWNTFVPKSRKINLISTLIHRALIICSFRLDQILENIHRIFVLWMSLTCWT